MHNNENAMTASENGGMGNHGCMKTYAPASAGLRFVNHMIDRIAMFVLVMLGALVTAGLTRMGGEGRHHGLFAGPGIVLMLMLVLYFGFYFFFEGIWQRTPGKWVTGTKVVREDGGVPTFGQIVGRTFARCIPFDMFSFLGTNVAGWHDRFSGTLVVSSKLTAEQVRMIDAEQYRKVNVFATVAAGLAVLMFALAMFVAGLASGMHEHRGWDRGGMMNDEYYYGTDTDGYGPEYDQGDTQAGPSASNGVIGGPQSRWMYQPDASGTMPTPGDLQ